MGRILAIDYGRKRVGLAVTDPLKIIATALDMVPAAELMAYLDRYMQQQAVDQFVIGLPKNLDNTDAESMQDVKPFASRLAAKYPAIPIAWVDERYTTKIALRTMIDGGMKKSDRRKKGSADKISAVIILQSYMEQQANERGVGG